MRRMRGDAQDGRPVVRVSALREAIRRVRRRVRPVRRLHEAYLQIFLAHAEYDTFIELMADEAEKQLQQL